jgi:hypothetical protein
MKTLKDFLNQEAIDLSKRNIGGGLISQAKAIARKYANNYTKAYDEIEKLEKDLTKNMEVQKALLQYNEEIQLQEAKEKQELGILFIQQIKKYTDENNHFRARAYIATLMGNRRLSKLYDALEDLHDEYYSYFGNDVIDLRSKIEVNLKNDIKNYFSNYEQIIRAL